MGSLAVKNQFIHTVINGYIDSGPKGNASSLTWVKESLFNPKSTQMEVDNYAEGILSDFRSSIPRNDSKRYQFRVPKSSDELLKVIFEESFYHSPQAVIRGAELIEGSFYPLWKRVCLIHVPKILGTFLGSTLVKLVISIATVYYSIIFAFAGFVKMRHFFIARVIPFYINNTPIAFIYSTNRILNGVDWARQNTLTLLFGAFVVQQIVIRGPTIPYLTAAIGAISFLNIVGALYRSPQTLSGFVVKTALIGAILIWKNSNSLSTFFGSIAINAESECLAISKAKAYNVWKRVIAENTPKRELRGV